MNAHMHRCTHVHAHMYMHRCTDAHAHAHAHALAHALAHAMHMHACTCCALMDLSSLSYILVSPRRALLPQVSVAPLARAESTNGTDAHPPLLSMPRQEQMYAHAMRLD